MSGTEPRKRFARRASACLRELEYGGIFSPSAALSGATNLTFFGPRTASTWDRPPLLASSRPATVIAKGAPPPGLLAKVRQIGAPHAGLVTYESACEKSGGGDDGDAYQDETTNGTTGPL